MTAITPQKTSLEPLTLEPSSPDLSSLGPLNPEPSSSEPSSPEPSSPESSSPEPASLEVLTSAPPTRRPRHPLLKGSLTCFITSATIVAIGAGLFTTGGIINHNAERSKGSMGCDFGPGGLWLLAGAGVGMLSIGPALVGTIYFTAYGIAKLQEAHSKRRSA